MTLRIAAVTFTGAGHTASTSPGSAFHSNLLRKSTSYAQAP